MCCGATGQDFYEKFLSSFHGMVCLMFSKVHLKASYLFCLTFPFLETILDFPFQCEDQLMNL